MNDYVEQQMRLEFDHAEWSREGIINLLDRLNVLSATIENYYFNSLREERPTQSLEDDIFF